MKLSQTVATIFALGLVGSASASTIFDVTYTSQSLYLLGSTEPLLGTGAGTAILDDSGVLTMTLHGELIADAAILGLNGYADILIDSTVHLITSNSGDGIFHPQFTAFSYPSSTSSYSQITSCSGGSLDSFYSCSQIDESAKALFGPGDASSTFPFDFYSNQSFTLDGGSLNIQAGLDIGSAASFLAKYELTPAAPGEPEPPVVTDPTEPGSPVVAVPEPFSLSLLIPGLITIATVGRRKTAHV